MTDKWLEKLLTFRAKRHSTKKVLLITGVADENSLAWGIAIHAALYRSVTGIILAIYPSEGGKARVQGLIDKLPADLRKKFRGIVFNDAASKHRNEFVAQYPTKGLLERVKPLLNEGEYIDGFLHAIAMMDESGLGDLDKSMDTDSEVILDAIQVSALSFKEIMREIEPILNPKGGSAAALTFHTDTYQPNYGWMTEVKVVLETMMKRMAKYYGRIGWSTVAISTGTWDTRAGKGITGFNMLKKFWRKEDDPLQEMDPDDSLEDAFFDNVAYKLVRPQTSTGGTLYLDRGKQPVGFCNKEWAEKEEADAA